MIINMDKYKKTLENLETMSERLYIPGVDIKEIVEHYKELLNLRTHIKKRCEFYGVSRVKIKDVDFSGLWPNEDYPAFYETLKKVCNYHDK